MLDKIIEIIYFIKNAYRALKSLELDDYQNTPQYQRMLGNLRITITEKTELHV